MSPNPYKIYKMRKRQNEQAAINFYKEIYHIEEIKDLRAVCFTQRS